jgi:hypothetical protein
MVEVHCRWRVGARVFRSDYRYRPPALGFKISVLLHVSCFAVPALDLSFRAAGESIVANRPKRSLSREVGSFSSPGRESRLAGQNRLFGDYLPVRVNPVGRTAICVDVDYSYGGN